MSTRREALFTRLSEVFNINRNDALTMMYVIVTRRGHQPYYWRDGGTGYTNCLCSAGLFSFERAAAVRDVAGVTCDMAMPLSHYEQELKDMKAGAERLLGVLNK